jgi:hypothetical protein
MPVIPIGGSFYKSDSLPIAAQECSNLYLNIPQTTSTTTRALFATPGIALATTAGTSAQFNRGSYNFLDIPYFVQGVDLYRIDRTIAGGVTTYTSVRVNGSVELPGTERVVIADNGVSGASGGQMCIILPDSSGINAYIYDTTNGLVQIVDGDFDGPVSSVRFVDGYFLFTKTEGQTFFISDLRDGTVYNALDFASAESDPDAIVSSFILHNEVYILGSQTIQPFQNSGGAGFPFTSVQGGIQRKGIKSIYGVEQVNDYMVFLGGAVAETPAIWVTDGGRPEKLSTTAIDNELSRYSDDTISSCFTWKYSQAGSQFIAFTFPDETCFVYDFTSKEWHTRESINSHGEAVPCRISSIVDVYGVLMVGDTISNKIGVLDRDTYTEFSSYIPRRFVTPQLDNEGQPFVIDALELVCETGTGASTGQGSDPIINLSYSTNGGRSFNDQMPRSTGALGEYDQRVIWTSLGRVYREVCFKFEASDPVKWAFLKVEAQID